MAQIIPKKYPIDSEDRKAVGFDFPFSGDAVFNQTFQTRDQIKANLINYLLTNKGERVFNPDFGADLRNLIFQNIDDPTLESLRETIQSYISIYFPSVSVREIKFNNKPERNEINFILTYQIQNFGITDNIDILLQ
jgi:hypothetical protein